MERVPMRDRMRSFLSPTIVSPLYSHEHGHGSNLGLHSFSDGVDTLV